MTDNMHLDDPAVAAVLAAAAAPAEGPVPGEAAALVAFRSVHRPRRRSGMPRYSEKAKLIAAAVFGGVVVISGAATAATGSLPLVSHGHSHSHPTPQNPSDSQGDDQGDDTGTTDTTDSTDTPDTNTDSGPTTDHAKAVTQAAHNKTVTGKDHGKLVCTAASDSKCMTQGQSANHRQNTSDSHGNAHQNTTSLSHRNTSHTTTPHGKSALPHGKSGQ